MEYIKKKFADEDGKTVSFWSTDDNVLCKDGKTLRENLNNIDTQFKDIANQFTHEQTSNSYKIKSITVILPIWKLFFKNIA